MCTFVRIKRPIKSQQTYNQSSSLIILALFVLFLCTSVRIFVFVPKPRSQKPEEQTKYQAILFKMAIVALLLNFQRVQLNGMLLKSYRNQHVNTAKWIRIRFEDSQFSPLVEESRPAEWWKFCVRQQRYSSLKNTLLSVIACCLLKPLFTWKPVDIRRLNDTKIKSIIHIVNEKKRQQMKMYN